MGTAHRPKRDVSVLFDGSLEGFLCIFHAYYYEGMNPLIIQEEDSHQPTLDTEEYYVRTDIDQAHRVQLAIRKKISKDAEYNIANAFLAGEPDRFMALFRYVVLGFKLGRKLDDHLQEDCVLRVHKLSRYVGREAHLLTGFCRFAETEGQIYYCGIEPVNDVLQILAHHFSDRMMNQAWIIHDKRRDKAAFYNGEEYVVAHVPKDANIRYSDSEEHIQDLWTTFFHSVNIKERKNPKVQRNLIPLYFRKSMVEFQVESIRKSQG